MFFRYFFSLFVCKENFIFVFLGSLKIRRQKKHLKQNEQIFLFSHHNHQGQFSANRFAKICIQFPNLIKKNLQIFTNRYIPQKIHPVQNTQLKTWKLWHYKTKQKKKKGKIFVLFKETKLIIVIYTSPPCIISVSYIRSMCR